TRCRCRYPGPGSETAGRPVTAARHQDLWVGLLADAQHPTGKPGITELDGEAELGRAAPMTATDQLQLGVGQSEETRQGAVVERRGEVSELGALGRSEQLAGRHGGLA